MKLFTCKYSSTDLACVTILLNIGAHTMNKIIIIIIVHILSSCAGTVITKQNAYKECPFLNVSCNSVNNNPEFPTKIVGKDIGYFCSDNTRGCLNNKTIYLRDNDWMVLAHERCHNFCSNQHIKSKRQIPNPFIDPSATE